MSIKELIISIYREMINVILKDINEEREEIAQNYLSFLSKVYGDKEINKENYDKMHNIILGIEKRRWDNSTVNERLSYFSSDKSFSIIQELSKKAYSLANLSRQNNEITISKKEVDYYINLMIQELDKVKDFNKSEAERMVSESILDFKYASGNHNRSSFRIGHIK